MPMIAVAMRDWRLPKTNATKPMPPKIKPPSRFAAVMRSFHERMAQVMKRDGANFLQAVGTELVERVVGGVPRRIVEVDEVDRRDLRDVRERHVVIEDRC